MMAEPSLVTPHISGVSEDVTTHIKVLTPHITGLSEEVTPHINGVSDTAKTSTSIESLLTELLEDLQTEIRRSLSSFSSPRSRVSAYGPRL